MTTATVLDREMYSEAEAARLLRLAPATLHYWLEGGTRRGRTYSPIIRQSPTGSRIVTWAEFVEAGMLRQYRRDLQVPMVELRAFIDSLRQRLGVPYPLAHSRPYVSGKDLVMKSQVETQLGAEFALVAEVSNQYVLSAAASEFFRRVTWAGDDPASWRPDDRPDSLVIIDPEVRFGKPSVGGISTSVLWEQFEGGETNEDLADTYSLSIEQVQWALGYEATPAA